MIREMKFTQGEKEISLRVIRSARRSIGLEVRGEDEVCVRIPARLSDRELKSFVEKHKKWILEKVSLVESRRDHAQTTGATPVDQLSSEEIGRIKEKITARVRYYCQIMGVTAGRITIRNQKTRWGSCSAKGNLNFNYQLYYLPDELLDYVVVHELAHRRHMNHSKEFWAEVEKYCPACKACRQALKEYELV